MKTILYLTDFYYQAQGRNYYEEDLYITSHLKDHFNLLIGHPQQAIANLEIAELVVFRNTGAVLGYREYFNRFVEAITHRKTLTFNSFDGHADMRGKQYLLDLTEDDYPVIPTVESFENLAKLGATAQYLVKPKEGADSVGLEKLREDQLKEKDLNGLLIQPVVDFEYEVSFYYLNDDFQYALYAPDRRKRWELREYTPTKNDLEFAGRFIEWNELTRGIQRVDACRLPDDSLLLMELEDLNPFLSLDLLSEKRRSHFIRNFIRALKETLSNDQ